MNEIKTVSVQVSDKIILPSKSTIKGLGDAVAMIAQPIARTIDAAFGTDVQNCGGCKARQQWLNELTGEPKQDV